MGAGILAAIGGGLSEASIGAAISSSQSGVIYGTGAGYLSGIRAWGGVGIPLGSGFGGRADIPSNQEFSVNQQIAQDIAAQTAIDLVRICPC